MAGLRGEIGDASKLGSENPPIFVFCEFHVPLEIWRDTWQHFLQLSETKEANPSFCVHEP
jgi:hypothetical protein